MAQATKIQWTDRTWNPLTGCTKISAGCANCYIERTPPFRIAGRKFDHGKIPLQFHADRLNQPDTWKKPQMVFVNSLSDLFHEDVPFEFIDQVFATMIRNDRHVFQVLTKRPHRLVEGRFPDVQFAIPKRYHGGMTVTPNSLARATKQASLMEGEESRRVVFSSDFELIPCADEKMRRVESGIQCLVDGVAFRLADGRAREDVSRVALLRCIGNSIVPQVAAEFIRRRAVEQGWLPGVW